MTTGRRISLMATRRGAGAAAVPGLGGSWG